MECATSYMNRIPERQGTGIPILKDTGFAVPINVTDDISYKHSN
jgi:hypothetical protein